MKYFAVTIILFASCFCAMPTPLLCTSTDIRLTVGVAMEPVVCTYQQGINPRITPNLPAGLIYTVANNAVTISGTPKVGFQLTVMTIGYEWQASFINLQVAGSLTSVDYGFTKMIIFSGVPLEPIPARTDSAVDKFSISPLLPDEMTIDIVTGTISGKVNSKTTDGQVYTVTAERTGVTPKATTTFAFTIKENSDMTTGGFVACYWAGITECLVPSINYFYKNPAQYCQLESKVDFSDTWASTSGSVWPGLDYRFLDYYSAYMYGYFNILVAGSYDFILQSDDGSLLYLDNLDTPLINRDGCTAGSASYGSKTLTVGRHLFSIRFLEFKEAAILKLSYKNDEAKIPITIADALSLKVGGRGPTFVEYPLVSGFVNSDLITYQPTMSSGAASTWEINPQLPSGIAIDPRTGYISGKPTSVSNSQYTVTASGYTGTATAVVRIVIASAPKTGLYAKYYKITDSAFCSCKALSGNQIDLKFIKIDSDINHPLQNPVIPYEGLTNDFNANFYVVWEGYLLHDAIGQWGLRITCDDGCKLLSTNNNELINHWGCHDYNGKEYTQAVSSNGYYYYKIEYQQSGGQGGMLFEWRRPNEGWEVVPTSKMFHAPRGIVTYKYQMAHYFKNVEIQQNEPIVFTTASFNHYSIAPDLPAGLSIQVSTGVISGTPTTEVNLADYTVTCQGNGASEKTILSMDVFFVLPPSGLSLTQNGQPVSRLSLVAFQQIVPVVVSKSEPCVITQYTISPNLPTGFIIDSTTGRISGFASRAINETVFVMTAMNSGGSFFMTLTIVISGCKGVTNGISWDNSFYTFNLLSGSATVSIKDESSNTIMCGTGEVDNYGNAILSSCSFTINAQKKTLCMNPSITKSAVISCSADDGCNYQWMREDDHYFPTVSLYISAQNPPYVRTDAVPSMLMPLTTLEVTPATMTVYDGLPMENVIIKPNGSYKTITVDPIIGEGGISLINPSISGRVYGSGQKVYTVTAAGDAGTVSTTITLNFEVCSEENGVAAYTFKMFTYVYPLEQSYEIMKGDKVLLGVYKMYANFLYTSVLCLESGDYRVKMIDHSGDAWGPSSNTHLDIVDGTGSLIHQSSFPSSEGHPKDVKWDAFTVSVGSVSKTSWKVHIGSNPGKSWKNMDYDSNDVNEWPVKTSGVVGQWGEVNTVYFITEFQMTDAFQYPLVQFSIYFRDGIIVYLNGEQVYSRNLGSSVAHVTTAISQYDDFYQRVGTAPGYKLRDGKNILCIEYHRHGTTTGDITWKAYVVPLKGTCITRVDGGSITESSAFNQADETAKKAWDGKSNTNWIENALPAWTVYSYNFDRVEWVNKVVLGSALKFPESDPTHVVISGSNDGTVYDTLTSIKQVGIWDRRGQTKEFMMLDHLTAYGHYKVEILDTANHAARTGLSVIDLQSCQLVYCTRDGDYPGVMSGMSVTVDCAAGFIGERTRKCGNENLKPSWEPADETECRTLNPEKKKVFIDFALSITGVTVEQMTTGGGAEILKNTVSNNFDILPKEVEAWKVKDVTDTTIVPAVITTATYIRITTDEKKATETLKAVTNGLPSITKILKDFNGDIFGKSDITFYMKPLLSERKGLGALSIGMIVLLVIVVVILGSIVAFWIWVRTKSKKTKNGSKQLRSGQGGRVKAQHLSGDKKDTRV